MKKTIYLIENKGFNPDETDEERKVGKYFSEKQIEHGEGIFSTVDEIEFAKQFETEDLANEFAGANALAEDEWGVVPEEIETEETDKENNLEDAPQGPGPIQEGEGDGSIVEMPDPNFKNLKDIKVELGVVDAVKKLRVEADRVIQIASHYSNSETEYSKRLFLGKSWLGKLLQYLNQDNPYEVKGGVKEAHQIPKTADTYEIKDFKKEVYDFRLQNQVVQVVQLREAIDKIINHIELLDFNEKEVSDLRLARICKTNSFNEFSAAKFFLGDELSKLRK